MPNITQRARHHAALASLHTNPSARGLTIWRKLRRIEAGASRAAEAACNTQAGADRWPQAQAKAEAAVAAAFGGATPAGFFVNGDPRGYALKIDPGAGACTPGMVTDWGGYGCLAATIDDVTS